jgi:hypothetical protein
LSWTQLAGRSVGIDWITGQQAPPTGFGTPSDFTVLRILEDTPKLHNVVVCTLCSCYPRPILGNSPEWYRTPNYRRRIVRWPRQVSAAPTLPALRSGLRPARERATAAS